MSVQKRIQRWTAAWGAVVMLGSDPSWLVAGEPTGRDELHQPVWRVSKLDSIEKKLDSLDTHPLDPVLRLAADIHANVQENVRDYTCTLVKRESVNGTLSPHEFMLAKIRNEQVQDGKVVVPFSVYLKFLAPEGVKGREVLYVRGANNGQLSAHEAGLRGRMLGTVNLDPTGMLAMRGNRYPITDIGVETLCRRLIEKGERDRQLGRCDVQIRENATVDERPCVCIEVTHPVRHQQLDFHKALVFMDKETRVPIRYEAYDWPGLRDGGPELIEEYTYKKLKVNVGLTDEDFSTQNPRYQFK